MEKSVKIIMEKVLRARELFRAGNEDIPNVENTFVLFASLPDLCYYKFCSRAAVRFYSLPRFGRRACLLRR